MPLRQLFCGALTCLKTYSAQNNSVLEEALHDNMRRLPWILSVVTLLLCTGLFLAWSSLSQVSPQDYRWVNAIGWLDLGMLCWLLCVALVMYAADLMRRPARWGSAPLVLLAASFLLFTGAVTVVEQWGRSSATLFLMGCVFVGSLVLIRPAFSIILYSGSFFALYAALGLTQLDPALLQTNRLHGFFAVVMGLLLSVLLWRKHTRMVLLQREFQQQRQALEASHEALKKQHAQLEVLAQRDSLTGLFNRREFARLAQVELERARRHHSPTAIIMIDLDFFKHVNDTYGHPAGDEVLKRLVAVLCGTLRRTDVLARMGGEEFMVLLPSTALPEALEVAEKLRLAVQQTPIYIPQLQVVLNMTASLGVTGLGERTHGSLVSLYAAADLALYAAKNLGRNRVEAYEVSQLPHPPAWQTFETVSATDLQPTAQRD